MWLLQTDVKRLSVCVHRFPHTDSRMCWENSINNEEIKFRKPSHGDQSFESDTRFKQIKLVGWCYTCVQAEFLVAYCTPWQEVVGRWGRDGQPMTKRKAMGTSLNE